MTAQKLAFIGAGNMAYSLMAGLLADGFPSESLCAADIHPEARNRLATNLGVLVHEDNRVAVEGADTVVLAVKPQLMESVLRGLNGLCSGPERLLVSIAAGIRCDAIGRWSGGAERIVRAMPNTPAMVQCGATGLYATAAVSAEQRTRAESVLRAVGLTVWLQSEADMDAVTALSGSGPAYFFLLMEAMTEAGIALGLDASTAALLAQQTALGAGRMAIESEMAPLELRRRVTSPGGTTERALEILTDGGWPALVGAAMTAARDRAVTLSETLEGSTQA
jgi:pyrroline-5-carboxylate reductase